MTTVYVIQREVGTYPENLLVTTDQDKAINLYAELAMEADEYFDDLYMELWINGKMKGYLNRLITDKDLIKELISKEEN